LISTLLIAWGLMAVCIVIHAGGVTSALRWLRRHRETELRFWHWTWLFTCLAGWMILLHLVEITVWALYYVRAGAMADLPSALYFSAVTYTTTGYGDLVLPADWRLFGGVEALTGILMCGWSTGFFFAVVSRMDRV
jgi:Ion channel